MPNGRRVFPMLLGILLLGTTVARADITGSISGIVKDSSGAVVTGAPVLATNTQTGIKTQSKTDDKGLYSFPVLPIGTYAIEVKAQGFKVFKQTGVVIDANSALRIDVTLELGPVSEEVTVQSDTAHVETQNTQMGEVITAQKMESVPLNGRAYTDLLSLQPGVVPSAYSASGSNTGSSGTGTPGLNDRSPSGDLNAGNQSVNGQRETSNGFMVNGANVEEGKNNGAAIIPNLDSIAEFRIITNNFDAQYGNYSGGQVNVVTKSGTNQLHGDIFEFLRNTDFDARNFFSPTVPAFIQNQFGGVLGGPIRQDKGFFFIDYQGTRSIQGQTQVTPVLSLADRAGDLSDQSTFGTGVVNGSNWANILSQRLGETVTAGEPYSQVFPNGVIPQQAISTVSARMLQFIPLPNGPNNTFSSVSNQRLSDDKGAARADFNTRFGQLFGYYSIDDFTRDDPFPNGGSNVPGFNALSNGRAELWVLGITTTFSSKMVNDFRFSVVRNVNLLFQPEGGLGTTLASLGFTTGFNKPGGIGPIVPQLEGVPQVALASLGMTFGVPSDTPDQFNNTFQWQDNVTRVIGNHTLTFGGQFHYDQINYRNLFGENGSFTFDGSETGSDIGDFLLGAPAQFIQASKQVLDSRSKYAGLFVQDSWRLLSNVTVNYGLRWEMSQPWYDSQNKIETIVPGEQSVVFPTAPQGLVVPGDPGIPSTLAPTQHDAFSPRLGVAYSPAASSGWLAKVTGGPGKTSIRAGYGIFYTAIEDLSQFQEVGDPPYGLFYVSPNPPLFESPYIDRASGNNEGQRFPFILPAGNVSPQHPNTTFPWATVEPISAEVSFFHKNRLPYAEHYEFSLQRQIGASTVVTASYVGTQAHKLVSFLESNPANAGLCLSLDPNNPNNQLSPNSPSACGPFGENAPLGQPFVTKSGQIVPTTRTVLGPAFGSNPYEIDAASSNYNSLQVSVRHSTKSVEFLVGYTFSKCLDNSSGLQETTNPFNPSLSRGLCIFDVTHNFVASYTIQLPLQKLAGESAVARAALGGWAFSGITTFATGLPVVLTEDDDQSLTGANADVPNVAAGKILANTNPRNGGTYFNTSLFTPEALGQLGDSARRFFHGPGLNNFDTALLKNFEITESKELQLRLEAFNVFNHAQFDNPNGTLDAGGSPLFGVVTAANNGRILQVACKIVF
jgi:hypothetical protein